MTSEAVTSDVATSSYRIASIPGDGIGVDVTVEARKVLDRAAASHGFSLSWTEFD